MFEATRSGYSPVCPSMASRSKSAWPLWRAYSSIMCTRIQRSDTGSPLGRRRLASVASESVFAAGCAEVASPNASLSAARLRSTEAFYWARIASPDIVCAASHSQSGVAFQSTSAQGVMRSRSCMTPTNQCSST